MSYCTPAEYSHASLQGVAVRKPIVVAAGAILLSACGNAEPAQPAGSAGGEDVGLAHVHGLGVDPADGVLYAASHFGVFRLAEGEEPVRVADRYQDTMGFTVLGPRTFVASGHPDFRKDPDLPPRLGLIRSDDAAQTWSTVSLTGEADLHALDVAAGTLYAADSASGRLLASTDEGATWETRSEVPAFDVAASPQDAGSVVVTTQSGVQRSNDGGRTFTTVEAPPLAAAFSPRAPTQPSTSREESPVCSPLPGSEADTPPVLPRPSSA